MIRGTTPTFKLKITDDTLDLRGANNIYATFQQGENVITKTGEDLTVTVTEETVEQKTTYENEVDVYLNQTESLSFKAGNIYAQLNWTYIDGNRACTNIISIKVGSNLIGSVLE